MVKGPAMSGTQIAKLIGGLKRQGKHPPLYVQVRDRLREAIMAGKLRQEQRLPSEVALAQQLGISAVTASRALADLVQEGLLTRGRKVGTFVSGRRDKAQTGGGMVAIVLTTVSDAAHPFAGGIIKGAERVLSLGRYSICLVAPRNFAEPDGDAPFGIPRDPLLRGAIVVPEEAGPEESKRLIERAPAVFFQNTRPMEGAGGVRVNLHSGMDQVVRHLVDLGHRRVGIIVGPRDHLHPSVAETKEAALTALRAAGVEARQEWILHGRYSVESGRALCARLLDMQERPTAVICGDDFVAVGSLQAAQSRGKDVPGELSIVGHNDMPIATLVSPQLTTLAVPAEEIGMKLGEMLIDAIERTASPGEVVIDPQLVVRQSTGRAHNA